MSDRFAESDTKADGAAKSDTLASGETIDSDPSLDETVGSGPTVAAKTEVGQIIDGRFKVVSVLGEGGFGIVYEATQLSTGQRVAIKLQLAERRESKRQAALAARFEREMRTIARLKHPNIVRLIDSGRLEDGALYMVLEFIEGRPLSDYLDAEGALSQRLAAHLMRQVLDALCYAHEEGIVHRDLKPHNIMVTSGGLQPNAMVLDFGIAGFLEHGRDEDYRSITGHDAVPGTPSYMAPEQFHDTRPTAGSDIYAWGLVFLECLTGACVVTGESIAGIMLKQVSDEPIPVPAGLSDTALDTIVRQATAKKVGERYETAREVLEALRDAAIDQLPDTALPSSQRSPSPPSRLTTPDGELIGESTLSPGDARPDRRLATVDESERASASSARESAVTQDGEPSERKLFPLLVVTGVVAIVVIAIIVSSSGGDEPASGPESTATEAEGRDAPATKAPEDSVPPPADTVGESDASGSATPLTGSPPEPEAPALEPALVTVGPFEASIGLTEAALVELRTAFPDNLFDLDHEAGVLDAQRYGLSAIGVMPTEVTTNLWAEHSAGGEAVAQACLDAPPVQNQPNRSRTEIGAEEADRFCRGLGMRLPTLREWEAVARGEAGLTYPFGDTLSDDQIVALGGQVAPGSLPENEGPAGVFDMAGGVNEWVTCEGDEGLVYCDKGGFAYRGGAAGSTPFWWRASVVGAIPEGVEYACHRTVDIGFRCVKDET